jgi:hypothetical protein
MADLFDDDGPTLGGCLGAIWMCGELAAIPFTIAVIGSGWFGWEIGSKYCPGSSLEYLFALLGGILGVFLGITLVAVAMGALLGGLIGWGLWYAGKWALSVEYEPLFWWPIYIGAAVGCVFGVVWTVIATVNTVNWFRCWVTASRTGDGDGQEEPDSRLKQARNGGHVAKRSSSTPAATAADNGGAHGRASDVPAREPQ